LEEFNLTKHNKQKKMKSRIMSGVTPQMKNIAVNSRFGNNSIARQQGSTVIKYDTLLLQGTELRFFEESNQRNFPLSNTGADGNKLGVGIQW
jgi:hypothetical protein